MTNLPAWTPLKRAHMPRMTPAEKRAHAEQLARELAVPVDAVLLHMDDLESQEVWMNSRYQVNVRRTPSQTAGEPEMVHLSIKRRDHQPLGPERYRDLMAIKDALVGRECEGVELYPARSREADSATQYHLWCIADPTYRFPFGFRDRLVVDGNGMQPSGSFQNPMEAHHHEP